jgi:hypothetical protein
MPIIGQAVISSRLEAKNLRGIYKFSFTNVTILYYFFLKFQIVFLFIIYPLNQLNQPLIILHMLCMQFQHLI